jgi:hypothetical protein
MLINGGLRRGTDVFKAPALRPGDSQPSVRRLSRPFSTAMRASGRPVLRPALPLEQALSCAEAGPDRSRPCPLSAARSVPVSYAVVERPRDRLPRQQGLHRLLA